MDEKTTRYCRRCCKPVDVANFSHRRIKTCIPCQVARTKRVPDLVRVVTSSRDSSRDYWLPARRQSNSASTRCGSIPTSSATSIQAGAGCHWRGGGASNDKKERKDHRAAHAG